MHLADDALHDLADFRVTQPRLGLALKLGVWHLSSTNRAYVKVTQHLQMLHSSTCKDCVSLHRQRSTLTEMTTPRPSRMWSPDRLTCVPGA